MGVLLLIVGFAMLAHAGYSTIQCESSRVPAHSLILLSAFPTARCLPPLGTKSLRPALLARSASNGRLQVEQTRDFCTLVSEICELLSPDRKYLRMVDQDYKGSPFDIHIECAIGSLLCLFGCVSCADDFEPIRMAQTFHRYANSSPFPSAGSTTQPCTLISTGRTASLSTDPLRSPDVYTYMYTYMHI